MANIIKHNSFIGSMYICIYKTTPILCAVFHFLENVMKSLKINFVVKAYIVFHYSIKS